MYQSYQPYQPYIDPNSVVYKPPNPYYGQVYGGVSIGTLIMVYGKLPFNANRFTFNLMIGSVVTEQTKSNGDIAMHFSTRFDEQTVVRNSRKNGIWANEERQPNSIPFQRSNEFSVMILVEENGYKIAVNGKHFVDFKHRMPISSVGIFNISGDVVIERIEYRRESRYSTQPPAYLPAAAAVPTAVAQPYIPQAVSASYNLNPVYNPSIPYRHLFANGMPVGLMIYISGRVNSNSDGFIIDFGSEFAPKYDIAFHFSVRSRNSEVVRNSFINNEWQKEEREIPNYPFTVGINFDMIIRVEANRYLVAVNGQHFIHYAHRIPNNLVNKLDINGDIAITSIRFAQS